MTFPNKEATLVVIKQYHIAEGFKFVVVESKTDRYVAQSTNYNNGCQWRLRASFSKIHDTWEIKRIEAPHTCLSNTFFDDHINLDSNQIATVVVNSIKANSSIHVKSLIAEIKSRYGYSVTYKKAWMAKQKAFALEFGDWDESYNHLPRRLQAVQESVPGTFVEYVTRPFVIGGVQNNSCNIFERVFWAFKPCIDGFNYCKPIV